MDCKEIQQLIKPYIAGEISDKDLDKLLEHIEVCEDCYEELEINYTIFSALMKLDDNPEASYNITDMLLEELKASHRYIGRKKRFDLYKVAIYVTAMFAMSIILAMQLNLWFLGTLWIWR
ncbi:MAG: zf-HC2 domain-containing protein [Lachnotalea sp.]